MENSISVKDLKKIIQKMDDDSRVIVEYYGDHEDDYAEYAPDISGVKEKYGIKYYAIENNY
jgi:hypothetical protein